MKIVIDISEELYEIIKELVKKQNSVFPEADSAEKIILNGTPLPKNHGRLIDADALECHRQIQIVPCGNGKYTDITVYYQNDIDIAPTIIEADKEESKEE